MQAPGTNHGWVRTFLASLPAMQAGARAVDAAHPSRRSPHSCPVLGYTNCPRESNPIGRRRKDSTLRGLIMSTPSVPVSGPYWSYPSQITTCFPTRLLHTSTWVWPTRFCGVVTPHGLRTRIKARRPTCRPQDTSTLTPRTAPILL